MSERHERALTHYKKPQVNVIKTIPCVIMWTVQHDCADSDNAKSRIWGDKLLFHLKAIAFHGHHSDGGDVRRKRK